MGANVRPRTKRDSFSLVRRTFLAGGLITAAISASVLSAHAQSGTSTYDGTYRPSISANGGSAACHGLVWDRFSIEDGKLSGGLSHSQAGFFTLSGSISPAGQLERARASGTYSTANLKGRFEGTEGSGTWSTSDGQCSGTWSASR